jgi:hypothetical protein
MAPICLKVCSSAPPVILTRTLQHHREAGLSDAQMRSLLRLAQKYQNDYMRVAVAFVNAGAELDIIEARPNLPQKRRLVARRARLFRQHEELLLRAYEQTARILSPAQIRTIVQIHEAQRRVVLKGLLPSLRRALSPSLAVGAARRRHTAKRKPR